MLIISSMFVQGLIVVGVVLFFLLTFTLNKKTKAPKGVEVPEKCHSCLSNSCVIKQTDIDMIKEDMRKEIEKCDDGNENEKE